MLHGGNRPLDIYRRIFNGINGTPMPGFGNAFRENPEAIWDVVAYVLTVTNRRRSGDVPNPGPLAPYVSAAPAKAGAAANAAPAEAANAEPAKTEPAKAEAAKPAEPAKAEPAQPEAKPEPAEPAKPE
jgi:hypothetical protein